MPAERDYVAEGFGPGDIPCSGCGEARDECTCGADEPRSARQEQESDADPFEGEPRSPWW